MRELLRICPRRDTSSVFAEPVIARGLVGREVVATFVQVMPPAHDLEYGGMRSFGSPKP